MVDLILELVGYTPDRPLHEMLLIEPSAGEGSFLLRVAARLSESCARMGLPLIAAQSAVIAYELDDESTIRARSAVADYLVALGSGTRDAELIADSWIRTGDYLLEASHLSASADFVVGNPPYIRLEDLGEIGEIYRSEYPTMIGRADVYVAFFEAALRHLKPGGSCGFICADRWMFNQYGAQLRSFITAGFNVETIIQMHHADAFKREVSAYPAITVIRNSKQGSVSVANLNPKAECVGVEKLSEQIKGTVNRRDRDLNVAHVNRWFSGSAPWPLMDTERLELLRRLETQFPTIEETGAVVGIGVATGADKVFITKDPELVEAERLLPLAMASDVRTGTLNWSGHYLVNPWDSDGLVKLEKHPKFAKYLEQHRSLLQERHVGQKAPANWFRTIDRVNQGLTSRPKLYLPDFKGRIAPVLDRGETYPHHNLYFVTAEAWDLEILGGLLLSDVAQFFIEAYGVRMRGGYLRFQAQYLRRIRVPGQASMSRDQEARLRQAFIEHNLDEANSVAFELYAITPTERNLLGHSETIS